MFNLKSNRETSELEKAIDRLHSDMANVEGDSDDYAKMADNLSKLYKLREHDARKRVSPDTLALICANLAGIVIIVGYEHAHPVTSKALGFVAKAIR